MYSPSTLTIRAITSGGISAPDRIFATAVTDKRSKLDRALRSEVVAAVNRQHFCTVDTVPIAVTVTLDGLSGSGKTTIARALVSGLGISHLESGYVFKAVAKAMLTDPRQPPLDQAQSIADKLKGVTLADVADPSLDQPEYAALVPVFSGLPDIQTLFYITVRRLSKQLGSAVVTGRSVGNYVFNPADRAVQIFLKVSPPVAAYRKAQQLESTALPSTTELATLRRNGEDAFNGVLSVPAQALVIDTDRITVNEVVALTETAIRRKAAYALARC